MKRYIDERTGKIVNILNNEEANKIVKIFIDYFFTSTTMPEGRLNLVVLLRDFIKLTEMENIYKFIEYIEEYKKSLKLSKEDEKDFDVLYKFFKAYKDFSEPSINIEDAKNYISDMTTKSEEISKKDKDSLDKTDRILSVLFENGFVLSRLAKISCDTWENKIQNQINNDKKEAIISIEQEIAYQDLLEFASKDNVNISRKTSNNQNDSKDKNTNIVADKVVNTSNKEVNDKESEKGNEKENNAQKTDKVSVNIQVPDKKEPVKIEVETKKVEQNDKKEEKVATIQINHGIQIDGTQDKPQKSGIQEKVEDGSRAEKIQNKEVKTPEIQINHGIIDDVPPRPQKPGVQERTESGPRVENTQNKEVKTPEIQINHGIIDDVPPRPQKPGVQERPESGPRVENTQNKEVKTPEIQINRGIIDDVQPRPQKPGAQERPESGPRVENTQNKEVKTPEIQINHGIIDDVPPRPRQNPSEIKPQNNNSDLDKNKKEEGYISNIHIYVPGVDDENEKISNNVNPLEIKNATENVDLKDSVDFFNNVIDSRRPNPIDDDEDGFRD